MPMLRCARSSDVFLSSSKRGCCRFEKKSSATRLSVQIRYLRGLRVAHDVNNQLKHVDRDVSAAINIGMLFLCDRVRGWGERPPPFRNSDGDADVASD